MTSPTSVNFKPFEDQGNPFDVRAAVPDKITKSKKTLHASKFKNLYEVPDELISVDNYHVRTFNSSSSDDMALLAKLKKDSNYSDFPKYRIYIEERHFCEGNYIIYLEYDEISYKFEKLESVKL